MSSTHESTNFFLQGPDGRLESVLWRPTGSAPAIAALVCHPHPLFGGTMHNKVVFQAAKALDSLGIAVLRFNFRGAGLSEGKHDRGKGEVDDVGTALEFLAAEFPDTPLLVAGFSRRRDALPREALRRWCRIKKMPAPNRFGGGKYNAQQIFAVLDDACNREGRQRNGMHAFHRFVCGGSHAVEFRCSSFLHRFERHRDRTDCHRNHAVLPFLHPYAPYISCRKVMHE